MSWLKTKKIGIVLLQLLLIVGVGATLVGCRGARSEKTPIHLNPNMDWQAKYKAQTLVETPPTGTVIWGNEASFSDSSRRDVYLGDDSAMYDGQVNGRYVTRIPISVSKALVERGQDRFNIYCAVCHDQAGSGQGIVVKRGFVPPPSLYSDRIIQVEDGYIFNVITHGVRTMPSYAKQIMPEDRWAIVAYVRALQKVHTTHVSELPQSVRSQLN